MILFLMIGLVAGGICACGGLLLYGATHGCEYCRQSLGL